MSTKKAKKAIQDSERYHQERYGCSASEWKRRKQQKRIQKDLSQSDVKKRRSNNDKFPNIGFLPLPQPGDSGDFHVHKMSPGECLPARLVAHDEDFDPRVFEVCITHSFTRMVKSFFDSSGIGRHTEQFVGSKKRQTKANHSTTYKFSSEFGDWTFMRPNQTWQSDILWVFPGCELTFQKFFQYMKQHQLCKILKPLWS